MHKENPRAFSAYSIIFLFFVSVLLMLKQLAVPSYFSAVVDDVLIYPSWAWQFKEALKEGISYPRWMPLNFWGYGSPTFILYPPLAFYLVALVDFFSGSVVAAMNIVKFIAFFLSGTGMYFLVKEFYPARFALLSAIFYLVLPFNIVLMYIFGSFAAMISCIWFSPILLFCHKYIKCRQQNYLIYAGACYGGLILTHLINAYMFSFVVAAFIICNAIAKRSFANIVTIPIIITIGLSISASYIVPVILERKYVNLELFTTETKGFIYSNMFILPNMTSKFKEGYFWPAYYTTMVFHVFIFCLLTLIFVVGYSKSRSFQNYCPVRMVNLFFFLVAVGSILCTFGISSFLWETIPFFKYILFPTRWYHVTAFALAFLSAIVFYEASCSSRKLLITIASLFAFCLTLDYYYIKNAPVYDRQEFKSAKAVNCTYEHMPSNVHIDRIDKTADHNNDESRVVIGSGGTTEIISWKSAERVLDVKAKEPLVVRFRTFNFPGWTAYLDGARTKIMAEVGTQAILVNVPKGDHRLVLVFEDTPIRYFGKLISLVSVILLSIFLLSYKYIPRKAA